MSRSFAAISTLLALVGAVASTRVVRRFRVEGESMLQAYAPGDRLLIESLSLRWRSPRVGEVVVVRQSGSDGRLDLKRLFAGPGANVSVRGLPVTLQQDQWFVVGDNLDHSSDSRQLGPVSTRDIAGRVWFRY